jgi:hypothetical protein
LVSEYTAMEEAPAPARRRPHGEGGGHGGGRARRRLRRRMGRRRPRWRPTTSSRRGPIFSCDHPSPPPLPHFALALSCASHFAVALALDRAPQHFQDCLKSKHYDGRTLRRLRDADSIYEQIAVLTELWKVDARERCRRSSARS